jgi:hypothetical protein
MLVVATVPVGATRATGNDGIRRSTWVKIGRVVEDGIVHRGHLRWDNGGSSSNSTSRTSSSWFIGIASARNYHRGARNGDRHLSSESIDGNGSYGDGSVYLWDTRVHQGLPWLGDYNVALIGMAVLSRIRILRTCISTWILQDHGSRVEILSESFLPLLHLASFERVPCGGCRKLRIAGIDWGHKAWWYRKVVISRCDVAHGYLMGGGLTEEPGGLG